MSKLLHVLAVIASMHGLVHCPPELSATRLDALNAPENDYNRTQGVSTIEFKGLCERKPHSVICSGHSGRQLTLAEVKMVDAQYRPIFQYRSPEASYGDGSVWDNWSVCGNCVEYALTLSELLALEGEDGRDMNVALILQCDQSGCDGHARLWVRTSDHGIVEVDNQHIAEAPHWTEGEYEAYITMDGKRTIVPFPGWGLDKYGTYWRGK